MEHVSHKKAQGTELKQKSPSTRNVIFISHRSTDESVADMLVEFLAGTGFPKENIFCSSLPGNDVDRLISSEIKDALKHSVVNIVILSQDYYKSAYCLNEAGVLWYEDTTVIPIALPEINSNNMYGFLNNEYKLRRLDSDTDISYIYDTIDEVIPKANTKASVITRENNKLRKKYETYLQSRKSSSKSSSNEDGLTTDEVMTDDEMIALYYILQKQTRKVSKSIISSWLNEHEIHDVNIDNAFDLLSSFEGSIINNDTLELGIKPFRKFSAERASRILRLEMCVAKHTKAAVDIFQNLWSSNKMDSNIELFVSYIVDERIQSFGSNWKATDQIKDIKQWENENRLNSILSDNYIDCLEFFIQNELVYASSWTQKGKPKKYVLYHSLRKFLFNCPDEIRKELQEIKNSSGLPF